MAKSNIDIRVKNIHGELRGLNLFKYFDDGIRRRLPKNLAKDFKEELISNIDSNRFGFELSPRWKAYKQRIGADTRPFVMFGHYKKAIVIYTKDGHLSVGFKKSTMHPRAKISMSRLARELEYGDVAKGIPARPLWKRTADSYFRERKREVGKVINKTLNKR